MAAHSSKDRCNLMLSLAKFDYDTQTFCLKKDTKPFSLCACICVSAARQLTAKFNLAIHQVHNWKEVDRGRAMILPYPGIFKDNLGWGRAFWMRSTHVSLLSISIKIGGMVSSLRYMGRLYDLEQLKGYKAYCNSTLIRLRTILCECCWRVQICEKPHWTKPKIVLNPD